MGLVLEALGIDENDPEVVAAKQDYHALADVIAALVKKRKQAGLTQKQVAEAMNTKQSAVSDIERSSANPSVERLQRYARAVGSRLILETASTPLASGGWHVIEGGLQGLEVVASGGEREPRLREELQTAERWHGRMVSA